MGGPAGSAHAESDQRVDGEEEGEADHRPPGLQLLHLRQRLGRDGAGRQRHPQPEHLAHLSALRHLRLPSRPRSMDHGLGGHEGGR